MKRILVAISVFISVAVFADVKPPKSADTSALAVVNGEPVTVKDLLDIFTDRHSGHAKFLGGDNEARTFLNIVIDDRLLVQEAYEIGLDEDETVKQLVNSFEEQKTTNYLVAEQIDGKSQPTKEEIRTTWDKELSYFIQVRQIVVHTRQEAEEVRNALLHGADFEALARTCSIAASNVHGGHLLANWGQFSPEWEAAVLPLKDGDLSAVIETEEGYEVVLVDARIEATRPEFAKVESQIESTLRERKLKDRKRQFSDELWAKYHVTLQPVDTTPRALASLVSTAPDTVVATWDGGKITAKELFSSNELRMFSMFPPERAKKEIDSRIRATINGPLVTLAARDRKIAEVPEIADAVAKYRDYIMESVLFRDHIFRDITISDEELKQYYDANKREFQLPEQRHVAHILVSDEATADEVRKQLAAGADFATVAKKSSRDFLTGNSGGELGWITPDKVPPSFKEVLALAAGEFSKPLRDSSGWHVVKVLEITPAQQQALADVKEKVRERVLDTKRRAERAKWVEKLRNAAKIQINDAAIKQFVKANEFKADEAPPQHVIK